MLFFGGEFFSKISTSKGLSCHKSPFFLKEKIHHIFEKFVWRKFHHISKIVSSFGAVLFCQCSRVWTIFFTNVSWINAKSFLGWPWMAMLHQKNEKWKINKIILKKKKTLRQNLKRYSILDLITSKQNNFNFSENKISGVVELAHQLATKLLQ